MRSVLTKGDIAKLEKKYDSEIKKSQLTATKTSPSAATPPDNNLSAMSKFIPGEAVAIFVGVFGILGSALATTPVEWIGLVTFVACLIIAIAITYFKATNEKVSIPNLPMLVEIPGKYIKTFLTAIAFVIWALNIEGFVNILKGTWQFYDPIIGGILIIFYTALIPGFYAWLSKQGT
jgi:hypothetical protein